MRIVQSLLFLVALFACVYAAAEAIKCFEGMSSAGIADPGFLSAHLRAALYGHEVCTALAAVALLVMAIGAFCRRARFKGIVIAIFSLLGAVIAVISVRDVGALTDAMISSTSESSADSSPETARHEFPTVLGRMSLRWTTHNGITTILLTVHKRAMSSLFLLGVGTALTLVGGRMPTSQGPPPLRPGAT